MHCPTTALVLLVAIGHLYILVLEMFMWLSRAVGHAQFSPL